MAGDSDEDEGRMEVAVGQYLGLEIAKTASLSQGRLVELDVVQNPLLWCVACKSMCVLMGVGVGVCVTKSKGHQE